MDDRLQTPRLVCLLPKLTTLRGAILEDAIPSTARHGTARGLPLKEVLEYVIPELNIQCLRLAINSPKVPEQLLKLDEQGVSNSACCCFQPVCGGGVTASQWSRLRSHPKRKRDEGSDDQLCYFYVQCSRQRAGDCVFLPNGY